MVVFDKDDATSSAQTLLPIDPTTPPLLLSKHRHVSSSPFKTFANVFIAIVGSGVLGLPYTFKKTGYLFGLLLLFSVAFLTFHCMMLLVNIRRHLQSKSTTPLPLASFGDLAFAVSGAAGRLAVDVSIVLAQAGFCVSYLIFISNSLTNVFASSQEDSGGLFGLSLQSLYLWGCFPFQLGLNSIPTLTHLAPLSIFADIVDLGAMGVVMVEDVMIFVRERPALRAFGGFGVFFYGVGVSVYAFEGIGMILPLESEASDKEKFGGVLGAVMGFIAVLYGSFGVLGYMAFGEETNDIVTTNFGAGLVSTLVQLGLCVNLFFTLPLMMNPVYEVVERRFWGGRYCLWLRWVMVFAISLVALTVTNFADFLSLVGSSVCVALGFVFPALFHLMVFKEELGWHGMVLDATIVVVGVVIGVSGTWSSVADIIAPKA